LAADAWLPAAYLMQCHLVGIRIKQKHARSVDQCHAAASVLPQQAARNMQANDTGAGDDKVEGGSGTHASR
jgi:hypothetical protein